MTPNLDQERVERAARGLAIAAGDEPDKKTYAHDMLCTGRDREPLYRWEYWAPLARAAITAYLGETHVVVPLNLAQRVTSIARRNEDAPEIHELSAMLSATAGAQP